MGQEEPIVRRYRPTDYMDIRSAESSARAAIATRKLAEANLQLAQTQRLAEIRAEIVKQSEPLSRLVNSAEYGSDVLRAAFEHPYGCMDALRQKEIRKRLEELKGKGALLREGERAEDVVALKDSHGAELKQIEAEYDQLLVAIERNQESLYREQVLENQQEMITQQDTLIEQQRDILTQQKRSSGDIARELQDIERRLRDYR
jgi:hypothetical protein